MNEVLILIGVALFGFLFTPVMIRLATKFGFMDKPNYRKIHTKEIPRLGGLAIFLSFNIGLILLYFFTDVFVNGQNMFYALFFGGSVIAALGVLDDKVELSAKQKLLGQVLAALVVVAFGVQAVYVSVPLGNGLLPLAWFGVPVTVIWIVAITNAINLIDGLDGLAGGISSIAAISISVIAFLSGNLEEGILSLLLVASIIGFLFFNFYPAKIFMGDVGSLFLGFVLGVLTIQELKQVTLFGVMVPLLLLAIPILDTLYAIIRRRLNKRPIFQPDKNHLHHSLLNNGFTHRKAVLTIYLISAAFSATGILIPYVGTGVVMTVVIGLLVLFQIIARDIGMIKEKQVLTKDTEQK